MPAHDDPLQRFTRSANRYCALIEEEPRPTDEQLLLELGESIAELYAAALRLPHVAAESGELPDTRLSHKEWQDRFFPFAAALRQTRELFEDADTDFAAAYMFLTDDLGDLYRDVKEGLLLEADRVDRADVLWQRRFTFWNHWGMHAAGAIGTITELLSYVGGAPFDPPTTRR